MTISLATSEKLLQSEYESEGIQPDTRVTFLGPGGFSGAGDTCIPDSATGREEGRTVYHTGQKIHLPRSVDVCSFPIQGT